MPALQVEEVSVSFGGVHALHQVTLEVEAGSVTGLIGPNGAGKTTLFNVITGLQKPNRGRVLMEESDITSARPHTRARKGLARTFQRLEVFGSLSARDNILVAAEIRRGLSRRGVNVHDEANRILERVGLADVADEQADTLSTGLARLLELGRAMATEPKILLLDEPSSGLDQSETATLGDLLLELATEGMAILLVEHDVDLVMRVCKHVYVLDFGEVIAKGAPDEVQRNEAVQLAYLGADQAGAGAGAVRSSNGAAPAPTEDQGASGGAAEGTGTAGSAT